MRIIHWRSGRRYTGKSPCSLRPSAVTSSLASTVPSAGHQLTVTSSRYARRSPSIASRRSASSMSRPRASARHVVGQLARAAVEGGDEVRDGPGGVRLRVVPRLVQAQEDPLRPAVERDVGRRDAAPRVVAEAEPPQLAAHRRDVLRRRDLGMLAGVDGIALRRQPERVVADRVQDVAALHAHEARDDVGADVAERMADVQPRPARVREHVEHVERLAARRAPRWARPAGPDGFGARYVPRSSQRARHFSSIAWASSAP